MDVQARTLTLVRDRFGEKPLYFGRLNGTWLFSSELKALREHPSFEGRIDRQALSEFLQFNCVPADRSIYQDIRKLSPGHLVRIKLDSIADAPRQECYWSVKETALRGHTNPFAGDRTTANDELHQLLLRAVDGQMLSDVPVEHS